MHRLAVVCPLALCGCLGLVSDDPSNLERAQAVAPSIVDVALAGPDCDPSNSDAVTLGSEAVFGFMPQIRDTLGALDLLIEPTDAPSVRTKRCRLTATIRLPAGTRLTYLDLGLWGSALYALPLPYDQTDDAGSLAAVTLVTSLDGNVISTIGDTRRLRGESIMDGQLVPVSNARCGEGDSSVDLPLVLTLESRAGRTPNLTLTPTLIVLIEQVTLRVQAEPCD